MAAGYHKAMMASVGSLGFKPFINPNTIYIAIFRQFFNGRNPGFSIQIFFKKNKGY
jgi:hypothetical protein